MMDEYCLKCHQDIYNDHPPFGASLQLIQQSTLFA